jgi:Flp pilus assembly protein TadD
MAGDLAGAAEFLGQAATEALRHAAFSDADHLAMEEVGVLETLGVTEDDDRRLAAIEHRGAALMGAEKYDTVTELLHGIPSDSINPVYTPLLQLRGRAASRLPDHTSHERAVTDLRRGLKLAQSIESPAIASLWTDLVYAYDSVGDFQASKAAYRKALLIAQQERNTALLVRLQRISCIFFQPEQVVSTITKGLAVARRLGLVYEHALSLNNLGAAYFHLRELDHAREAFGRSRDELQRLGGYRCDTPMNNLGLVALMEKRPDEARDLLDAAKRSCRDPHSLIFIRSNAATLDGLAGNTAAAVRQLETLAQVADRTGDLFYRDCIRHNWAVALLESGDAGQALAVIQDCPVHFDAADEELIRGKRARLLVQIHAALGSEPALQETVRREARVLDTTTRPVAWLYSQRWYLCDIEFWED